LRFSSGEVVEFLNQVMGLALSEEDISALESRTEGWIAGLQLAAISIQGREDAPGLIKSFTGSHRLVLDYLIEEVLEQQTENLQKFFLQTAILKQLSGPLCDALTSQEDGQVTLEELERSNLFIIPLDNERRWYRYHHLFADLLKQRLKLTHPSLIDDLHAKASTWYEENDNLPDAIHHAMAISDFKTATRLVENGALQALSHSDLRFIFKWVDLLPDSEVENSPWLYIYHCWALLISGQVDTAIPRIQNTDWLLDAVSDEDESKKQEMVGYIAGLKALLSSWKRDYQNGIKFADQAIANLPEDNWIRGYCAIVMGGAYWGNGDIQAAKEAFAESALVGKNSGNIMLQVSGACNLAYTLELEGQLRQAKELFHDTFKLTDQDGRVLPVAGYIHVEIGRVFYELNELDLASQHLLDGIKLCKRLADGRAERTGHYLLARVHLANGDIAEAANSIREGDQADRSPETTFDLRGGEYLQIRLWLKENNLKNIEAWLQEHGANLKNVSHIKTLMTYSMQARALIAIGRGQTDGEYLEEAIGLLNKLFEVAEEKGWWSKVIEILTLQALCLDAQGDTDKAFSRLERALSLAEPEGYIRTFVDEGTPMAKLLYKIASLGTSNEYTNRLLASYLVSDKERSAQDKTHVQTHGLIEALSEREIEVLQLIAEGLTNKEIASRLFLTLNTIKSHTRNIFEKLDVNNRTQAASKAKALGILSPD
jgi:LuxR family maltose regulon positive regulatory protein